jgi:hypothetical protein
LRQTVLTDPLNTGTRYEHDKKTRSRPTTRSQTKRARLTARLPRMVNLHLKGMFRQ